MGFRAVVKSEILHAYSRCGYKLKGKTSKEEVFETFVSIKSLFVALISSEL